jgi:hypothetical protein
VTDRIDSPAAGSNRKQQESKKSGRVTHPLIGCDYLRLAEHTSRGQMQGVEGTELNLRPLLVTTVQHLPVFAFHIRPKFDEAQFAVGHVLQKLRVKFLCVTGLKRAFRFLPQESRASFVEGDSGSDGLSGRAQGVILKRGGVRLLRVKLHQRGRVPVAHLAPLGTQLVENRFGCGPSLASGAGLPQLPQPRQPGLPAQ